MVIRKISKSWWRLNVFVVLLPNTFHCFCRTSICRMAGRRKLFGGWQANRLSPEGKIKFDSARCESLDKYLLSAFKTAEKLLSKIYLTSLKSHYLKVLMFQTHFPYCSEPGTYTWSLPQSPNDFDRQSSWWSSSSQIQRLQSMPGTHLQVVTENPFIIL